MGSLVPDSRGSTPEAGFSELQPGLQILIQTLSQHGDDEDGVEATHRKAHAGHCIRQEILDAPNASHQRDQFRLHHGFQALLTAMASTVHLNTKSGADSEQQQSLLDILQVFFGILSAALQDHRGNQRYFHKRIEGGGWQSLKSVLLQLLFKSEGVQRQELTERVLGCLLACGLNDESMVPVFSKLSKVMSKFQDEAPSKKTYDLPKPAGSDEATSVVRNLLGTNIDALATVHNPEAFSIMLELWVALEVEPRSKNYPEYMSSQGILSTIRHVAAQSMRNLRALHTTPLLNTALSCLVSPLLRQHELTELQSLTISLLELGITNLGNAHLLYRQATSSPLIANTLLKALRMSHNPPYIHFDLSAHGYASVEFPSIGRVFPPTSPNAGYTLTLWFHVVNFDSNYHTTLFGAFDSSQTCFMLLYLEKDTHNLILQTSVTSSRPSVRFKNIAFQHGRWYHVAIVHRRPKTTMSSRASLFVDGVFFEQVKSNYPASPPLMAQVSESANNSRRSNSVQAFLGTPQDLASRIGKGLVFSQWRLASAHLFGEALSDDLIAVYHQLGPRYSGNYQDRLGSFQTYEASAALNLRNEILHPGKEDKTDIVTAVRQFASALLPESQIIMNVSAIGVLNDDANDSVNGKLLLRGLGKQAIKNFHNVTRGRSVIAINGAIPAINEALQHSSGFGVLTGDPVVIVPQSLDDAAWRVGGCAAVGLSLVEAANSPAEVNNALNIVLESVKGSWRNSEAMERENGFGVLATLLAKKLGHEMAARSITKDQSEHSAELQEQNEKLSLEVLSTILEFVGYKTEKPLDSVINNPLAYRTLLVDPDFWRRSYPTVQRLYYKQFVVFGTDSRYHLFNAKRLAKMRKCYTHASLDMIDRCTGIARKWVDALKGDIFNPDTFAPFIEAFRTILTLHPSSDSLRSLALFITYATHKPRQRDTSSLRPTTNLKQRDFSTPRRQTLATASPSPMNQSSTIFSELSRTQIAVKILHMYTAILCEERNTTNIRKFAKTVTNRVRARIFHRSTVIISDRLLLVATLSSSQRRSYSGRPRL